MGNTRRRAVMDVTLEEIINKLNVIEEKIDNVEREFTEFRKEVTGRLNILERKIELQEITFKTLAKVINIRDENEKDSAGIFVREGTGFDTTRVKRVRSPLI